jgi:hypothetical protein
MRAHTRSMTAVALLFLAATTAEAQERYAIGGDHVAIFNLAGELEVVGTTSGQVTVDVARGGRDAAELSVEVGRMDGVHTLRIIYPADRITYGRDGGLLQRWTGSTQLTVRADGTWGDIGSGSGRRVRIAGDGRGLDAHADLRVGVPRGQRVELFLGAGRIVAENVDGDVRLDAGAGGIVAEGMAGGVVARTGSGNVRLDGMDGSVVVTTGSGSVRVAGVRGDSMTLRTGSGTIAAEDVTAGLIRARTGSGGIRLEQAAAREVQVNTGSGSVNADLVGPVDNLTVRTGSGGVTIRLPAELDAEVLIRTGSGRIETEIPVLVTAQDRRSLRGVVGEGRGTLDVRTGSGSVRILRR